MTQHVNEDTLIREALGLLEPAEESSVRRHLSKCTQCHKLLADVEGTLDRIREVTLDLEAELPPLPTTGSDRYRWLRVAAMLVIAFGMGLVASEAVDSPRPDVIRQQIFPRTPDRAPTEFVVCEEIDLSWSLHWRDHHPGSAW